MSKMKEQCVLWLSKRHYFVFIYEFQNLYVRSHPYLQKKKKKTRKKITKIWKKLKINTKCKNLKKKNNKTHLKLNKKINKTLKNKKRC